MIRRLVPALLLILSACTVAPTRMPDAGVAMTPWREWQLQGRISVRDGEQGWHASLFWEQAADRYVLRLGGPLGQGAIDLRGDEAGVWLRAANGRIDTAPDPETLLHRAVGVAVPVSGLRYWVQGLPDPAGGPAPMESDSQGRVNRLQQAGWDIRFERYGFAAGRTVPTKIRMRRDALELRILIDNWRVGAVDQGRITVEPDGYGPARA